MERIRWQRKIKKETKEEKRGRGGCKTLDGTGTKVTKLESRVFLPGRNTYLDEEEEEGEGDAEEKNQCHAFTGVYFHRRTSRRSRRQWRKSFETQWGETRANTGGGGGGGGVKKKK